MSQVAPPPHTCLVGGAVRDRLLGLPEGDRDWVVISSTPQDMLARGFRPVGNDFPVFLHPQTHEEYALARTERKTALGYHGFIFHATPDVTLEEDLYRRDITINAMAITPEGILIDPFGGQQDLEKRLLRHVSPAFAEDPVRILRVARFAARLAPLGFQVAEETHTLMRRMVETGEVDALVPERVWKEFSRALAEPAPRMFIEVLRDCGALAHLIPELDHLWGVPQPTKYHPEIDTGEHVLLALDQATLLSPEPRVRFAALMHDLGKGITPKSLWPSHPGHEQRGARLVREVCARLKTPREFNDLAYLMAREHGDIHRIQALRPDTLLKLLERIDARRRPLRVEEILIACLADCRGRLGYEDCHYPQADYVRQALERVRSVPVLPLLEQGLSGARLATALRAQRLYALTEFKIQTNS